jgi:hypothetical protein
MSLGPNDCLGVSQRAVGPDKFSIAGCPGLGSTYTAAVRFVTVIQDDRKGSFDFVQSPIFGDKFIVRREGRFCIYFTGTTGGAVCAIAKNPSATVCSTSPATTYNNAPASNKVTMLASKTTSGASQSNDMSITPWLVPGDEVYILAGSQPGTDTTFVSFEYLGGT